MSKLLIVEDEARYREELGVTFANTGHEVRTASSGQEAIAIGARYRPDVLIADWMLKNHIHGLQVSKVLQTVKPDIKTILITGFVSTDLRNEARSHNVFEFIEKPFSAPEIVNAVEAAVSNESPVLPSLYSFGIMEVDSDDSVRFTNRVCKEMFKEAGFDTKPQHLDHIFDSHSEQLLDEATHRWVALSPKGSSSASWRVRAQSPIGEKTRFIVLQHTNIPRNLSLSLIEMLLGLKDVETRRWPFAGRIMFIDQAALLRKSVSSALESVGACCYSAESPDASLPVLANDEGIEFLILDYETPGGHPSHTLSRLLELRPSATIVGTSGADRRLEFAAMGVEYFLQKPWNVDDLMDLLTGRIASCLDCDLDLPLRRPRDGEKGSHWACATCSAHYFAVIDESASESTLSNVKRVEGRPNS